MADEYCIVAISCMVGCSFPLPCICGDSCAIWAYLTTSLLTQSDFFLHVTEMPTITLHRWRHQLSAPMEFPATANLEQSLNALAISSNVAPPYTFRVYNPDRDQLNLTSGRCVGAQPLEAEVETAPLQARVLSLEADVAKLKADSAAIMAANAAIMAANADLWAPRVRNLAAQLLLLACGRETLRTTETDYFRQLGVQHESVCALATDMAVAPAQVVTHADGVIACHNAQIHFGDLAQLEQEVQEVQRNITPQLEACCRWECKFINAYSCIKERFPTRFA